MIMQGSITNVNVLVTSPTSLADAMTVAMERYQKQLEQAIKGAYGLAPNVSMSHNALYVEGVGYSFTIIAVLHFT